MAALFDDILDKHTSPGGAGTISKYASNPEVDSSGAPISDPAQLLTGTQLKGQIQNADSGSDLMKQFGKVPLTVAAGYAHGALPSAVEESFDPNDPSVINHHSMLFRGPEVWGSMSSPFWGALGDLLNTGAKINDAGKLTYAGMEGLPASVAKNAVAGAGFGATNAIAEQARNAIDPQRQVDLSDIPASAVRNSVLSVPLGMGLDKLANTSQANKVPEAIAEAGLGGSTLAGMKNPKVGENPVEDMQDLGMTGGLQSLKNQSKQNIDTGNVHVATAKASLFDAADKSGHTVPMSQVLKPFADRYNSLYPPQNAAAQEELDSIKNHSAQLIDQLGGGTTTTLRDLNDLAESAKQAGRNAGSRAEGQMWERQPGQKTPLDAANDKTLISTSAALNRQAAPQLLDPSSARAYVNTMDNYGKNININDLASGTIGERASSPPGFWEWAKRAVTFPSITTRAGDLANRATLPLPQSDVTLNPLALNGIRSRQDVLRMLNNGISGMDDENQRQLVQQAMKQKAGAQ